MRTHFFNFNIDLKKLAIRLKQLYANRRHKDNNSDGNGKVVKFISFILIDVSIVTPPIMRGPNRGERRAPYSKRARESVRRRIFESAMNGGDWKQFAESNGVKVETARDWISKGTPTLKKSGGTNYCKITEDHRDSIMEWISINPELSLKELADMLLGSFDVQVCYQTI